MRKFLRTLCGILLAVCLLPVPVHAANTSAKLAAITFDDGPGPYTETLLAELAKRNIHATFFVAGYRAVQYKSVLKDILAGGHQLGNHTYNHANLNTLSAAGVAKEISSTRSLLVAAGGEQTYYIRPPYGNANKTVRAAADAPLICWSVDPEDWKYHNADTVCKNILSQAYDGCIILVHDIYKTSVNGALAAIDQLQAKGYEFVTVHDLLLRRGVTPQNGVIYYDAKNKGVNLSADQIASGSAYNENNLSSHWAYASLKFCLDNGYLQKSSAGYVLPDRAATRGEFLTALAKLSGVESSYGAQTASPYSDISDSDALAPYAKWANEAGLMGGFGGAFHPNALLTREQMAAVVSRYLESLGRAQSGGSVESYSDAASISDWAKDGVALCTGLSILQGTNGAFRPQASLTRAETAVIIERLAKI
jgi:peptidoglycan/xylan/chitin deacetylase (PgdA/CDA1 family)